MQLTAADSDFVFVSFAVFIILLPPVPEHCLIGFVRFGLFGFGSFGLVICSLVVVETCISGLLLVFMAFLFA